VFDIEIGRFWRKCKRKNSRRKM